MSESHYDFDSFVDRSETNSIKFSPRAIQSVCGNPHAHPFWVADMDFRVEKNISDEVTKLAKSGLYGYPTNTETEKSFVDWARRWHGWEVNPSYVVAARGMLSSIAALTELMTNAGEGIIVPTPAYQPFLRITRLTGRCLIDLPLVWSEEQCSYTMDFALLEEQCSRPDTTLMILCSPHNPYGKIWTEQELRAIADITSRHNVAVISDEIHADLIYPGEKHIPFVTIARDYAMAAVTCMAPSKTFNIAGEHISMVIFNDITLRNEFTARQLLLCEHELSLFSLTVGKAAYKYGEPWLKELVVYLKETADFITRYVAEHIPGVTFITPHASFVGVLDCTGLLPLAQADAIAFPALYDPRISPSGGVLSRFFGQRASVAVNDGTWFGGEAYNAMVRFNFGTQRSTIAEALQRMRTAVLAAQKYL
ncbi:MalY/PatB family protein [Parasphaerochaeta coccoides]|uniref:cysteine-S-conjugate beta-lyase n=1 Tax=Parasphaerochaeta coccoides (strain ATCC BAA-1237 / DSM 17374 / SPN1) TaxID=760011 RepID=F4GI39_PARC1|nr:aminotransferase class I/II-fold pyridoxal phosphate-dependent enzyme [Parasphaerochaeta coccoides]AEC02637.1 Cystathionine beta-lyase [Parasphaerochaeta coccoides DSM 17374]